MKPNYESQALICDAAAERLWHNDAEIFDADREFRISRRRAYLRMIRDSIARGHAAMDHEAARVAGEFEIALDSLAGIVDGDGRMLRGLPPMPRKLGREWRRAYSRISLDDDEETFVLRLDGGRWYLAGGSKALIRLELLRMRGLSMLRARASILSALASCREPHEAECRDGELGRIAC